MTKTYTILCDKYDREIPRTHDGFEALPGVGRKTTNVVLNTAFGEPNMAVDTRIFRLANRTRIAPGKGIRAVEDRLVSLIPKEIFRDVHHWFCCTAAVSVRRANQTAPVV